VLKEIEKDKTKIKKIIKKIVNKNNWLNGFYDYLDGDLTALNEEENYKDYTEYNDLENLFSDLKFFDGVFKFENLLFFKHWNYGTFVYDLRDISDYVEHLNVEDMSFKEFEKIVNKLLKTDALADRWASKKAMNLNKQKRGDGMKETIELRVDRGKAQQYFHTNNEYIQIDIEGAENVAKATNGEAFFKDNGQIFSWDSKLENAITDYIYNKAKESVEKGSFREGANGEKIAIIKLTKEELEKVVEEVKQKREQEEKIRKRLEEQQKLLENIEQEYGERGYYTDDELKKLEEKRDELRDYIRSKTLTDEELKQKLEELKDVLIKMSIRSKENRIKDLEEGRDNLYKKLTELEQKYEKLAKLVKEKLTEEEIINFFTRLEQEQAKEQIKQQFSELFEEDDDLEDDDC